VGGNNVAELTAENRAEHWRRTRNLMWIHLTIWFIFSYVVHWFAVPLNNISFFGWPLGYYMAAQGALIVFVVQLFLFNRQQHAIDVKFGVAEEQHL
jgi:putative solute:sodium symporter small subunit